PSPLIHTSLTLYHPSHSSLLQPSPHSSTPHSLFITHPIPPYSLLIHTSLTLHHPVQSSFINPPHHSSSPIRVLHLAVPSPLIHTSLTIYHPSHPSSPTLPFTGQVSLRHPSSRWCLSELELPSVLWGEENFRNLS
ncbi:hypothetical protein Pcinc_039909, partial [Petrolisthes cinctipes]